MGKLRFTLTYVLFWMIILFSCLLAENFAFFSANHVGGMSVDSSFIISFAVIVLLIIYYYLEHRKNGLKFDKVLLPIVAIFTLLSIFTICWQGPRTFINPTDNVTTSISFTPEQKLSYSLQFVIWGAFIYGFVFVFNRFHILNKWLRWVGIIFVFGVLIATFADLIMEFQSIVSIFNGTYEGKGLQFIIYNENVWAHLILVALLTCIILNISKFRFWYYIMMVHFLIVILFTSSATSFFVGTAALLFYTFFEIIYTMWKYRKKLAMVLSLYIGILLTTVGLFALLIVVRFSPAVNFWGFIQTQILQKDYTTLTSRTGIWEAVLKLLVQRPLDLIFGLGYRTSNLIFTQYYLAMDNHDFAIMSTHNAFVEILLRHGIIGVISYLGIIGLFIYGIAIIFKKKHYRMACLYLACFLGLLTHGISESTLFLSANTSSVYTTLIFYLPVISFIQSKHYQTLNEDLQSNDIEQVTPNKGQVLYFVQALSMAMFLAFAISIALVPVYTNTAMLIVYIVMAALSLLAIFFIPLIVLKDKAWPVLHVYVLHLFIDNIASFSVVGVTSFVIAVALPRLFEFNVLTALLFTFISIVAFVSVFWIMTKKENNAFINYLNVLLYRKLKTTYQEVENG